MTEHKNLIHLFEESNDETITLQHIKDQLEQHIRFEERVLFPEIQKIATEAELIDIEKIHQPEVFEDNTDDEFWTK